MNSEPPEHNPQLLVQLLNMKMPFRKYKDTLLCDLPVFYLEWFQERAFPKGRWVCFCKRCMK